MIIIFPSAVNSCGSFDESALFALNSSINWSLVPLRKDCRIYAAAGRTSTQSSSLRDDYDRAESTIMQIAALDRVTRCHVLLLDDIDWAVLSILRCPTSLSTLLWLLVSMTFSASWLSSWLGLLRSRVSENKSIIYIITTFEKCDSLPTYRTINRIVGV